jgi:DNA-binding NarL/FixJ family response regulator
MKKTESGKITVLLADDHAIVREGVRMVLDVEKDIQVIAEAKNGREAVALVKKLQPQVVVMDIAMPLLNGFEAARQMVKMDPSVKILILSAHNDDEYIDRMIAIGASGFVIKQSSAQILATAVREVLKGNIFFSADIAKRLEKKNKKSLSSAGVVKNKNFRLSSREAEVLQLIAEGKANKEMAGELEISIKTVEKHRQHLMEKLNIHDTAGLTRYAISAGIIESSVQITIR